MTSFRRLHIFPFLLCAYLILSVVSGEDVASKDTQNSDSLNKRNVESEIKRSLQNLIELTKMKTKKSVEESDNHRNSKRAVADEETDQKALLTDLLKEAKKEAAVPFFHKRSEIPYFNKRSIPYFTRSLDDIPYFNKRDSIPYFQRRDIPYFTKRTIPYFDKRNSIPYFTKKDLIPYFTRRSIPYFTRGAIPYFTKKDSIPYFQRRSIPYFTRSTIPYFNKREFSTFLNKKNSRVKSFTQLREAIPYFEGKRSENEMENIPYFN